MLRVDHFIWRHADEREHRPQQKARITKEILETQEEHLLAREKPKVISDLLGVAPLVEIDAIASAGALLLLQPFGDRVRKVGALIAATPRYDRPDDSLLPVDSSVIEGLREEVTRADAAWRGAAA